MANLDDMRIFAELAASGSFTAAARVLGVTKQTISRRLKELEDALGVELIRRTTRRVALTDVGVAYASRCSDIVRDALDANRAAASHHGTVAGTLRITADHTFGEALLPSLVARYTAQHRDAEVEVFLTARKVDLLEEGYDVAFRVGAPPDVHHLTSTRLGPAQLWTVAAPSYLQARGVPTTPHELAKHDCLAAVPHLAHRGWPFAWDGALRLIDLPARVRANDVRLVRQAALGGVGIAHLPTFCVQEDVAHGRLHRILSAYTPEVGGLHLVYPHSRLLAPKVRAFVALAGASTPLT